MAFDNPLLPSMRPMGSREFLEPENRAGGDTSTDADRATAVRAEQAGSHGDHDHHVNGALRFVQLTPPGPARSIVPGTGITQMPPGSHAGL